MYVATAIVMNAATTSISRFRYGFNERTTNANNTDANTANTNQVYKLKPFNSFITFLLLFV